KETTLSDGVTPAFESVVEYKLGKYDVKTLNLWLVKRDKWLLVAATTVPKLWPQHEAEMEAIVYSLTAPKWKYVSEKASVTPDMSIKDDKNLSPLKAKYKNKKYGFSLNYPAKYVEKEPRAWGGGESSEVFRAEAPKRVPQLSMSMYYMEDGTPFSEIKDTYLDAIAHQAATDIKFTSEKEITLSDGTPAYELEIEYRLRGYRLKTLNLWVQKYDRWFAAQAMTTADSWRSDLPEMKTIVSSFTAPMHDDPNAVHYHSFRTNVPMRDGKTLKAQVVLPGKTGPYPIIFWYTGYTARVYKLLLMRSGKDDALFGPDGRANYGFVIVSLRGRYENKDAGRWGGPTRGEDGADVIKWIKKQPWSGKVGMWGWGVDGAAVYDTAVEFPQGITAMVAQFAPWLSEEDYTRFYPGGVLLEANVRYIDIEWPGTWDKIVAHPQWDKWWDKEYIVKKPKAADINVPVLLDNGWYTFNVKHLFRIHENLKEKSISGRYTKFVIGPWSQNYTGTLQQGDLEYPKASKADKRYHRRFFDYWLKGIDAGFYDERPINYYQMGEESWKTASTWPPSGTKDTKYYLHGTDKTLTTRPAGNSDGFSQYTFDPKDPSPGIGGLYIWPSSFFPNPVVGPAYLEKHDKKVLTGRNDYIVFDTPILSEDLEIAGNPSAKLYIQSNTPDTDIIVRLVDYDPNAPTERRNLLVGIAPQRMRYREGLRKEVWMQPGETYEVEVKMDPVAYTWKKGHQARMIVSSSAYPLYAINPNNKKHFMWDRGNPLVATIKVWSNSRYPSHLVLPSK
ncbi:MAG: CocE/NonD family hydrolase, partial [Candidatus Aerophobus sp.]